MEHSLQNHTNNSFVRVSVYYSNAHEFIIRTYIRTWCIPFLFQNKQKFNTEEVNSGIIPFDSIEYNDYDGLNVNTFDNVLRNIHIR